MLKQALFAFAILNLSPAALAVQTVSGNDANTKDNRVLTIVSDTETEKPVCAVVYDKSAIKSTDLPECEGENLALAEAVKPQGVDLATMKSYTDTALISCLAGHAIELSGLNDKPVDVKVGSITYIDEKINIVPKLVYLDEQVGGALGEIQDGYSPGTTHKFLGEFMAITCALMMRQVTTLFRGE